MTLAAARRGSVPKSWLRKRAAAGLIPSAGLGRSVRFTDEHVRELIADGERAVMVLPRQGSRVVPAAPVQPRQRPCRRTVGAGPAVTRRGRARFHSRTGHVHVPLRPRPAAAGSARRQRQRDQGRRPDARSVGWHVRCLLLCRIVITCSSEESLELWSQRHRVDDHRVVGGRPRPAPTGCSATARSARRA